MSKSISMTEGKPLKLLLQFTLPLLVGNIFQQFYSMVDSIIVGRFVSKEALASIGATSAILFLMISVIIGFNVGMSIVTAQFAGAKDTKNLKKTFATGVYVCVVMTVFLSVIGNLAIRPALALLKTPSDIVDGATIYLVFNFSTCIAPIAYNSISSFMRSLGDVKTPLYALIISSIINIILDLVFVLGFNMGVVGVALATAIAQMSSALFCFYKIKKNFSDLLPSKGEWKPSKTIVSRILKLGIPMAIQNAFVSFGMMSIQGTINSFGTNVVAGYTAANKVDQIALQFMMAIGTATSTYTGQNYGAKKAKRIFDGLKASMLMTLVISVTLSIIMVTSSKYIVLMFIEAVEVDAITVATSYLKTVSIFYIMCGTIYVFSNMLRGMGMIMVATVSSFVELGVKIVVAAVFSSVFGFGYIGIWYAWPASWLCAMVMLVCYYFFYAKKTLVFID